MKPKTATHIFLIERGSDKSARHPLIICSRLHTAKWESRGTENGATVLESMGSKNLFLVQYKGYKLQYDQNFVLFDGKTVFNVQREYEDIIGNAIWWSYDLMPKWLQEKGVKYPTDDFTIDRIFEDHGTCYIKPVSRMLSFEARMRKYEYPEWLLKSNLL